MIRTAFQARAKFAPYVLLASLMSGAVWAQSADVLTQNTTTLMEQGRYTEALSQAEDIKRQFPARYEGYYYAAASLLRMGLIPRAETAVTDAAKYAGTDKTNEQKALEASLARHKQAYMALGKAQNASDRGENYVAATQYTQAFELLGYHYEAGQRAAQLWVRLDDLAWATRVYKALDKPQAGPIQQEAQQFLKSRAADINGIIEANIDAAWTALQENEPTKAYDWFDWAIRFEPSAQAHAKLGFALDKSPYLGIAITQAATTPAAVISTFKTAWNAGLRLTGRAFPHAQGAPLINMLCTANLKRDLQNIYGPAATTWANNVCADSKLHAEWNSAEAMRSSAMIKSMVGDYAEAKSLYQKAQDMFQKSDWTNIEKSSAATENIEELSCSMIHADALQAIKEDRDIDDVETLVDKAKACPTADAWPGNLDDKFSTMREEFSKKNAFTVKVCNKSGEADLTFGVVQKAEDDFKKWMVKGWYKLAKDECTDMDSTFGNNDEMAFYLTASTPNYVWWPSDKADNQFCMGNKVTDREYEKDYKCVAPERMRSFKKIVVKRDPRRNGVTFNFKKD